jgi:hypothetical protein
MVYLYRASITALALAPLVLAVAPCGFFDGPRGD